MIQHLIVTSAALLALSAPALAETTAQPALGDKVHKEHKAHDHKHGQKCGHKAVQHDDHVDYDHDGHKHKVHDTHVDECGATKS